jgi:hypothetical protein
MMKIELRKIAIANCFRRCFDPAWANSPGANENGVLTSRRKNNPGEENFSSPGSLLYCPPVKSAYCSVAARRKLRTSSSRSGLVKWFNPGLP